MADGRVDGSVRAIGGVGRGARSPAARCRPYGVLRSRVEVDEATIEAAAGRTGRPVALSEHEERILAEIERQLVAEDPRFVARARRRGGLSRSSRMRLAVGLALLGVIGVIALVVDIVFAAIGMGLLFAAILVGASAITERSEHAEGASVPPDEREG